MHANLEPACTLMAERRHLAFLIASCSLQPTRLVFSLPLSRYPLYFVPASDDSGNFGYESCVDFFFDRIRVPKETRVTSC